VVAGVSTSEKSVHSLCRPETQFRDSLDKVSRTVMTGVLTAEELVSWFCKDRLRSKRMSGEELQIHQDG